MDDFGLGKGYQCILNNCLIIPISFYILTNLI